MEGIRLGPEGVSYGSVKPDRETACLNAMFVLRDALEKEHEDMSLPEEAWGKIRAVVQEHLEIHDDGESVD